MKKFLLAMVFGLTTSLGYGAWQEHRTLGKASFTATNETAAHIDDTVPGTILLGVVLSSEPSAGVIIYDSSATANTQIADLSQGAVVGPSCIPFNVVLSSGLTYTTTGNTVGVTFIYRLTHPTAGD